MFDSNSSNNKLPDVLLVENDVASRDIIKYFLKNICNIDFAENGLDAINMAKAKKYMAILMDINLGIGMSGLEVTQELRKLPEYKNTPIAAITAYAMAGDREKFLSLGCSHYLSKPFDKAKLLNLVNDILNTNQTNR
jgi:CheY-like chemotaxis protein